MKHSLIVIFAAMLLAAPLSIPAQQPAPPEPAVQDPSLPADPGKPVEPASAAHPVTPAVSQDPDLHSPVPAKAEVPAGEKKSLWKRLTGTKSAEPAKSTTPVEAAEPDKPVAEPTPAEPAGPVETLKPAKAVESVPPATAPEPAKPAPAVEPVEPAKPEVTEIEKEELWKKPTLAKKEPSWKKYELTGPEDEFRFEVTAAYNHIMPSDGDWDSASGLELKFRYDQEDWWGWGVGISESDWSYPEGPFDAIPAPMTPMTVGGDAKIIPLTAFAFMRQVFGEYIEVLGELGLRYVMVDSDITVVTRYRNHFGHDVHYSAAVENINHLMGVLGGEIRGGIYEQGLWLVGAEYQFDVGSADPNWLDQDIGNDFSGFVLRVGGGFEW